MQHYESGLNCFVVSLRLGLLGRVQIDMQTKRRPAGRNEAHEAPATTADYFLLVTKEPITEPGACSRLFTRRVTGKSLTVRRRNKRRACRYGFCFV